MRAKVDETSKQQRFDAHTQRHDRERDEQCNRRQNAIGPQQTHQMPPRIDTPLG